ncbi:DUF3467 domain-containing protein [Thioflexithrix psekupsensis]|jgi:hypothetical protein|uniref:DUF3467 domain-containing protein n=1 Tax=Thioflexithrix psekupsensis TaxID=1570016 RepID=A0A251X6R8_9GAMM|nr:DUF3467 domain-containing protein [Thioflexithrix psekupsensis]OUD13312.1 hypothetical protein TPSD3_11855 [Thioflexithrix psekupsensis]
MKDNKSNDNPSPRQVRVRYEQTQALYASQFVLNVTGEEVIINFSSGSLPDPTTGDMHLPIHSRIALSQQGVRQLVQLLNQALASQQQETANTARLPSLQ